MSGTRARGAALKDMKRTFLVAAMLAALPLAGYAQQEKAGEVKPKPAAEKPAGVEMQWTAPADCEAKPVMTDADINRCRPGREPYRSPEPPPAVRDAPVKAK